MTADAMADAVAQAHGKAKTPELVKAIESKIGKLEDSVFLAGNFSIQIDALDTLLGKVEDKSALSLVKPSETSQKAPSERDLLGKGTAPKGAKLSALVDDLSLLSGPSGAKGGPGSTGLHPGPAKLEEHKTTVNGRPVPSEEKFAASLEGITGKTQPIFNVLTPELRANVDSVLSTTDITKDQLKTLLHFSGVGLGKTTEASRVFIRAILLVGVSEGVPLAQLSKMKEVLRQGSTEQTSAMLDGCRTGFHERCQVFGHLLTQANTGQTLKPIDLAKLAPLNIKAPTNVQVSPDTAQNLRAAQAINLLVKSLVTEGAANQAPDLYRTSGGVFHLHNAKNITGALLDDQRFGADMGRAVEVDNQFKAKGQLGYGEEFMSVTTMAYGTVLRGAGKCGEHAATAFSLLTDPPTLKQLGIQIADGSQVFLVLGERIDHSYVLIAEHGAANIVMDNGTRRLNVTKQSGVVVVDAWMPIPCAHTLDRANDEIQKDPQVKQVAEFLGGDPHLTKGGTQIPIPYVEQSLMDRYKGVKADHTKTMQKAAKEEGAIHSDKAKGLALAFGTAAAFSTGKTGMYMHSPMSTDTPGDTYQVVDDKGTPLSSPQNLFIGNEDYVDKEVPHIAKSLPQSLFVLVEEPATKRHLPPDLQRRIDTAKSQQKTA